MNSKTLAKWICRTPDGKYHVPWREPKGNEDILDMGGHVWEHYQQAIFHVIAVVEYKMDINSIGDYVQWNMDILERTYERKADRKKAY